MIQSSKLALSLRQQIVDSLREDVLCGRISIGERLSISKLVERFEVSCTPIREALAQLSYEGLLESKPNHGVHVAPNASAEICELLLPLCNNFESFALLTIFDDLNETDFGLWDEMILELKSACEQHDIVKTVKWDIAFRRSIIRRAEDSYLEITWSAMIARLQTHFWQAHCNHNNIMDVFYRHRELIDIFRNGDKQAAIKAYAIAIV